MKRKSQPPDLEPVRATLRLRFTSTGVPLLVGEMEKPPRRPAQDATPDAQPAQDAKGEPPCEDDTEP